MDKVAVVILNYNGQEYLKKFLGGVVEYSGDSTVYVVDNASSDQSVDYVKQNFPSVKLIELEDNSGFCGGYNKSLKMIEAKYYVILNSDVEVTPNWVDPVIDHMEQDEKTAACQPKILAYNQKDEFEYAGAAGGYIDFLGYPFCRGRIFFSLEKDEGQYDDNQRIFWATGACLFIRSNVFHELGGFDEDYFAHMEEIDLCWRINRYGKEIHYIGNSTVYHVGGGTLSKENPRKTYLNFRNSLITVIKNSTIKSLFYKLPIRLILDFIAGTKFLLTDGFNSSWAVVRANWHFYSRFPYYLRKRRKVRKLRKNKTPLQYKGSIVIDHYALGIQKFKDLAFSP